MFGYVNICKNELKIKDYTLFRAHYCGLCKAIGKQCSNTARLGLSYDMTFLALVLSALDGDELCIKQKRCCMHPFHRHAEVHNNRAVDYAADMSAILTYLKFADDLCDEHSIKSFFGMCAYKSAVRKAKSRYSDEYDKILLYLNELSHLEKANSGNIDEVADCFANILKVLFTPPFISNDSERRILEQLGYNTGRWIYIIDAFNDIEKDVKKKSYNPFVAKYVLTADNIAQKRGEIICDISLPMDYTLSRIAAAYELLSVRRSDDILKNIIYIGLKEKQDSILNKEITDESI